MRRNMLEDTRGVIGSRKSNGHKKDKNTTQRTKESNTNVSVKPEFQLACAGRVTRYFLTSGTGRDTDT